MQQSKTTPSDVAQTAVATEPAATAATPEEQYNSKLPDTSKVKVAKSKLARGFYIGLGLFLTTLGILGIWLPLVPTTIFLIGAAWCFARSSPRLLAALKRSKLLGPYLRVYTDNAGLSVGRKVSMICILWTGILLAVAGVPGKPIWVDVLLIVIMLAVTVHLITIRPARKEADTKQ